jgi:hypothetical protein
MPLHSQSKAASHWKRLGLLEGAPEGAIEAAWLWYITLHHPDRGGDADLARQIHVARDELKGEGAKANEYVAAHYEAQPWLVLGIERGADSELAQRVGRQLASELRRSHRRLAERVEWAMANFGRPVTAPNGAGATRVRVTPPPPRRRPERAADRRPAQPATPGVPDGLPARVDIGTVAWREPVERSFKLTWKRFPPFEVHIDAPSPLQAEVTASKALPGRFAVVVSVDWDSPAFSREPSHRGYTLDETLTVRWAGGGEALVHVRGILLYPANVTASASELDLGTVDTNQPARGSLVVTATAPTTIEVDPPQWLARIDAAGRVPASPLRLEANAATRIEFAVQWPPILERAVTSFAAGRPVRPTGLITIRWDDRSLEIPAQITVRAPRRR